MAGSSSLTPKSVSPSRAPRRFTLDEANRTMPLVKRIVGDIVKIQQRGAELEIALAAAPTRDQAAIQSELGRALERFQAYVKELSRVGCQLKDPKIGLIDFPGRHQDRDISLCWKLGEDRIGYWHEVDAGYAGRQPVNALV